MTHPPYRLITLLNPQGTKQTEIAYFKVVAYCGQGSGARHIECEFDPMTGAITNLPPATLWTNLKDQGDVAAKEEKLVHRFHIEIGHAADAPVVVAQREGGSNSYRPTGALRALGDELLKYSLPPCGVSYYTRGNNEQELGQVGPVAVWTDPMKVRQGGSNRVDLWYVEKDGKVGLICAYLVTLDDGKTFSLVQQERWAGQVYLRRSGTSHVLRSDDERVIGAYHGNDKVRAMLDRFVFVPGEHSENFEKRLQILQSERFRELINGLSDLEVWEEDDNFWFERDPGTDLRDNQGIVQFLTYGVGRGSMGIIKLKKPVELFGTVRDSLQFEHFAVVGEQLRDEQGILFMAPGTVVDIDFDRIVNMDNKKRAYPPKLLQVVPRTIPVPIEPTATSAAA